MNVNKKVEVSHDELYIMNEVTCVINDLQSDKAGYGSLTPNELSNLLNLYSQFVDQVEEDNG